MNNAISRKHGRLRKLVCESLESRQLMAGDLVYHNFMMPEDSDMSGDVTPLDALAVINQLNAGSPTGTRDVAAALDVDADGTLSPLDALTVINYINRSIGEDQVLISQVSIQNRIERLDDAMDSDLLPPNIDLAMANQIRDILRAGGFPEIGDRMVNGVLNRELPSSASSEPTGNGDLESASDDGASMLSSLEGLLDQSDSEFDVSEIEGMLGSIGDRSDVDLSQIGDILSGIGDGSDIDLSQIEDILGGIGDGSDVDFSNLGSLFGVNDPTNDNGNGSFVDSQTAAPVIDFVEAELRKQLKVGQEANIAVAVFNNEGEITSGTWRYLTEEGIAVSGNWSYVTGQPETLNLFRSNVDIEKRIYVQYPGSGFIYYSWLPGESVGYYFSPIGNASAFKSYFDSVPGSEMSSIGGFTSYSGDLDKFDGIAPIENQPSALFAIDKASRGN